MEALEERVLLEEGGVEAVEEEEVQVLSEEEDLTETIHPSQHLPYSINSHTNSTMFIRIKEEKEEEVLHLE